jgi:hypothetical protein
MLPQSGVPPLHVRQTPPPLPQALAEVPGAHACVLVQHPVPPQLPQLRIPPQPSGTAPHWAPHEPGVHPHTKAVPPPPHVAGAVQSELLAQPHVPFDVHAWPAAEPVQLTQALPLGPHAVAALPLWQLVPSQQAPLQTRPPEHAVPHVLDAEHACPMGQSPAAPQPHVPPSWQT